jgi:nitroreductase
MPEAPTVPLDFETTDFEAQLKRARDFHASLSRRRSVRHFSAQPVDPRLIDLAIATAGRAPSGANQQPWTFVVITNPALRAAIREAAEAEERESYQHRMPQEWKDAIAHLGTDWRKPHLTDAPVLIVLFEQTHGVATGPDGEPVRVKHYYTKESCGIAAGFLIAALHMAGLATLTHTPSPMQFLSRLLERPPNEKPYLLLPVGYPVEGCRVPAIEKKPLAEILVRRG